MAPFYLLLLCFQLLSAASVSIKAIPISVEGAFGLCEDDALVMWKNVEELYQNPSGAPLEMIEQALSGFSSVPGEASGDCGRFEEMAALRLLWALTKLQGHDEQVLQMMPLMLPWIDNALYTPKLLAILCDLATKNSILSALPEFKSIFTFHVARLAKAGRYIELSYPLQVLQTMFMGPDGVETFALLDDCIQSIIDAGRTIPDAKPLLSRYLSLKLTPK